MTFLVVPCLSSCGAAPPVALSAVRDSAGVVIVETVAPDAVWRLSPQPIVRVGVVEGEEAYQFSSIAYAGTLGDGRLVVADRQSQQIRFFDGSGQHLLTVGRRGSGPGEFRGFADVILAGDSVLIFDGLNRRLVLVGPTGEIIEEQSVGDHPSFASAMLGRELIGATREGSIILSQPPRSVPPKLLKQPVYSRDTVAVVVSPRAGGSLDTIARVPGGEYVYQDAATAGVGPVGPSGIRSGWVRRGVSFGYYPYYAAVPGSLIYASGERHGFDVFQVGDSAGAMVRRVRRTGAPPVHLTQVETRYLDWIAELSRASGSEPAQAVAEARAHLAALPRDRVVPRIDGMLADELGHIWQRESVLPWDPDDSPRTWNVYSREGQPLAKVVIPASLRITQLRSEHIVAITRDDDDVPYVVIYRLIR